MAGLFLGSVAWLVTAILSYTTVKKRKISPAQTVDDP
jgi:hypothetical protein